MKILYTLFHGIVCSLMKSQPLCKTFCYFQFLQWLYFNIYDYICFKSSVLNALQSEPDLCVAPVAVSA